MAANGWLKHGFAVLTAGLAILGSLKALAEASPPVSTTSSGWFQSPAWREYRWGFSVGYGGTGVTNPTQLYTDSSYKENSRSEGPLVTSVFIEKLLSDTFLLGLEHMRGVSLVPFSAGESFTGVAMRWYFSGPAPSMISSDSGSTIMIKRYVPFFGVSAGYAVASITRPLQDKKGDPQALPLMEGSGAYVGIRAGVDVQTGPGQGGRPEFVYSTSSFVSSFSSSAGQKMTFGAFALQYSWYFNF